MVNAAATAVLTGLTTGLLEYIAMAKQRQAAKDRRKQPRTSLTPKRTDPMEGQPPHQSLRMTLPTQARAGIRITLPTHGSSQSTSTPLNQAQALTQGAALGFHSASLPLRSTLGSADSYPQSVRVASSHPPPRQAPGSYTNPQPYRPQPYAGPRAGYQTQPRASYQPTVPSRYSAMSTSIYQPAAAYNAARASYGHSYTMAPYAAPTYASVAQGQPGSKSLLPSHSNSSHPLGVGSQSGVVPPGYASVGNGSAPGQVFGQAAQLPDSSTLPAGMSPALGTAAAITTNGAGHPHPT